jgi:hypothetical protein
VNTVIICSGYDDGDKPVPPIDRLSIQWYNLDAQIDFFVAGGDATRQDRETRYPNDWVVE